MIAEFSDASYAPTGVLNVLGHPALFLEEPLQTMFGLVMSTFSRKEVLKEVENRKLW